MIDKSEIKFTFIRSPGPGGQNVNKVATAVLLRFDVKNSFSLTEEVRERLLSLFGSKLTLQGVLLIKATRYRTQERNKLDAMERLESFIKRGLHPPKKRKKTKPTYASKQRRLDSKKIHSTTKSLRQSKHHHSESGK